MEINKIHNIDCIEGMRKFVDDESVDLIITSPPYNIGIDYDSWNDKKPWDEYYAWCEEWLKECYRVLKKDGRIAVNHYLSMGDTTFRTSPISELFSIMKKIGFKNHAIPVWIDKHLAKSTAWGSWLSSSSPYVNTPFEGIIIDYKEFWKKQHKGIDDISRDDFMKLTRGVWDIPTETHGLTKCNFPVELPEKIMKLLSYQGDTILDPFSGSATTAVAALRNNRNYIGFEISKNYFDIGNDRLETERLLMSQTKLF